VPKHGYALYGGFFSLSSHGVYAYTGFAASQRVTVSGHRARRETERQRERERGREIGTVWRDPLLVRKIARRSITRPGGIYPPGGGGGGEVGQERSVY